MHFAFNSCEGLPYLTEDMRLCFLLSSEARLFLGPAPGLSVTRPRLLRVREFARVSGPRLDRREGAGPGR